MKFDIPNSFFYFAKSYNFTLNCIRDVLHIVWRRNLFCELNATSKAYGIFSGIFGARNFVGKIRYISLTVLTSLNGPNINFERAKNG